MRIIQARTGSGSVDCGSFALGRNVTVPEAMDETRLTRSRTPLDARAS
jgi:hypothetical protein